MLAIAILQFKDTKCCFFNYTCLKDHNKYDIIIFPIHDNANLKQIHIVIVIRDARVGIHRGFFQMYRMVLL